MSSFADDPTPLPAPDFPALVKAHARGVWRYLRMLGADETAADDLSQEVFLEVYRRPFEYRGPKAAAAYLRRVARSHFLATVRRVRRERVVALADELEPLCAERDLDSGSPHHDALAACLDGLTDRARQGLTLLYRDERPRAEIASLLGISLEGVKKLLQRARATLRDCLERRHVR